MPIDSGVKQKPGPVPNLSSRRQWERTLGQVLDLWLEERTVRVAGGRVPFTALYDDYNEWLLDNGEKFAERIAGREIDDLVPSRTSFGMLLYHRHIPNRVAGGKSVRDGIVLKEAVDAAQS